MNNRENYYKAKTMFCMSEEMNKYEVYLTTSLCITYLGILMVKINVLSIYISGMVLLIGILLIGVIYYWRWKCIADIYGLMETGKKYQAIIDELEGADKIDVNEIVIKIHFTDEDKHITHSFQHRLKRAINILSEADYIEYGLIEPPQEDIFRLREQEYITVVVDEYDMSRYSLLLCEILMPGIRLTYFSVFLIGIQLVTTISLIIMCMAI